MSFTIHLTPLHDIRAAVWERIATSAHTSGYTLLAEGKQAEYPYLAVGPAYKGSGGSDPKFGVHVVVQVDAYASSHGGGTHQVSQMQRAVTRALSEAPITVTLTLEDGTTKESRPVPPAVEDDVLSADLVDQLGGPPYASRTVRYRFMIST